MFDVQGFKEKYRGIDKFCETHYFEFFLKAYNENQKLFEHIKFANDVLEVPPIKTFILYYRDSFNEVMTSSEKQGLGACFGYLYRFIYEGNYKPTQTWVGDKITGIKSGSVFVKGE